MAKLMHITAVAAFIGLTGLIAPGASADDYPKRPITIIAAFPPGASTDAVARVTRDYLAVALGQPIVIDNRGGASGTLGAALVANANPDGYTLLVTSNPPITMNMYTQKSFPYDAKAAFAPITLAAYSILALAVNSSVPANNVAELVAYVKKNPGKVSFGSAGLGSAHHISGALINKIAGIEMVHVPYRGGAAAIQDLVAGQIQVSFGTMPAVLPHQEAGTIRILAIAEEKRHPELPDIPTVAETIPGVVTNTWIGFFAPAGTPRPIIEKLNKAVNAALGQADVVQKFRKLGLTAAGRTPEQLQAIMTEELVRWSKVIPAAGIEPER